MRQGSVETELVTAALRWLPPCSGSPKQPSLGLHQAPTPAHCGDSVGVTCYGDTWTQLLRPSRTGWLEIEAVPTVLWAKAVHRVTPFGATAPVSPPAHPGAVLVGTTWGILGLGCRMWVGDPVGMLWPRCGAASCWLESCQGCCRW